MTSTRWMVVCALALVGCGRTGDDADAPAGVVDAEDSSDQVDVTDAELEASAGDEGERVEVVEVVDGDTLVVRVSGSEERVRVIGINTPERDECFYSEAREAMRALVDEGPVALIRDVSDRDQFGRLVRFVETEAGLDAGAELVRGGFARSIRSEPEVSRNDLYDDLQAEAQEAARGQWSADACGEPAAPGDVQVGIVIEADAAGPDDENLNGEWVRFTNEGDEPLDLAGWEVADESSTHRYRFGDVTLAPGDSVTLFTGCGNDSASEVYWCNDLGSVWNNTADTVYLSDPNGNLVVSESYR